MGCCGGGAGGFRGVVAVVAGDLVELSLFGGCKGAFDLRLLLGIFSYLHCRCRCSSSVVTDVLALSLLLLLKLSAYLSNGLWDFTMSRTTNARPRREGQEMLLEMSQSRWQWLHT